jgi:hypothetical protein
LQICKLCLYLQDIIIGGMINDLLVSDNNDTFKASSSRLCLGFFCFKKPCVEMVRENQRQRFYIMSDTVDAKSEGHDKRSATWWRGNSP